VKINARMTSRLFLVFISLCFVRDVLVSLHHHQCSEIGVHQDRQTHIYTGYPYFGFYPTEILQIDWGYVNLVFMFVKIVIATSCSRWYRVLALERRVNNNESSSVVSRLAFFKLVSSMLTEDLSTFIGRVVYVP